MAVAAVLAALLAALTPGRAARADAAGLLYEVNAGLLHHDTDNLWSGFRREGGVDGNVELLFRSLGPFLGGEVHPALGGSYNFSGDTSKAYADLRWRYSFGNHLFAGFGLGGAIHDGETELVRSDRKALGSRVLFHISLEAGYRLNDHYAVSAYFDHMSNAYIADENEGMDTLGARIGYRF